jgi:putative FmdB family regulatory protein
MPLYEYYCESCNGVFEALRSMREASEPAPCPVCDRDGQRIMPTSFAAFTFRDGMPRRIPDRGTYWHFDKEVKKLATGKVRAWEHPEVNKPEPPPIPSKGEADDMAEAERLTRRAVQRLADSGIRPATGPDGKPSLPPEAI